MYFRKCTLKRNQLLQQKLLMPVLYSLIFISNQALAICVGFNEDGLWQSMDSQSDLARVKIEQNNCEVSDSRDFYVTVWTRQSSGALFKGGIFPGSIKKAHDRSQWIYSQYSGFLIGETYIVHQWNKWYSFSNQDYLRVYINWESIDSRPNRITDFWFQKTSSQPGGSYTELRNSQAGMCLDADFGSIDQDGDKAQTWSCWNKSNQLWYINNDGTIVNVSSGKCLEADLGTINQDGTTVQLWSCWGGQNQKWVHNPNGTITNAQSGRCLEADLRGIDGNGDKIQLWSCWGGKNQLWERE